MLAVFSWKIFIHNICPYLIIVLLLLTILHSFIHLFSFSLHIWSGFIQVVCLYLLYGMKQLLIVSVAGFSFAVGFFFAGFFSAGGFLVA